MILRCDHLLHQISGSRLTSHEHTMQLSYTVATARYARPPKNNFGVFKADIILPFKDPIIVAVLLVFWVTAAQPAKNNTNAYRYRQRFES